MRGPWRSARHVHGNRGSNPGNFSFKRRTSAGLQGDRNESGQNFQGGGKRRSTGLRAEKRRECIGRFVAAAGGDDIGDRVMQFVGIALRAFEIVPKGARYSLLESVWFIRHSRFGLIRPQASQGFILGGGREPVNQTAVLVCLNW